MASSPREFEPPPVPFPTQSLSFWHRCAPPDVSQADGWDDGDVGWREWVEHLARRRQRAPIGRLFPGKGTPLVWSLTDDTDDDTRALVVRLHRLASKRGRHRR